jgi:hypothetical protein
MKVYVPILGLEKIGLSNIQLLKIRNLNGPGSSTLPPATNVNLELSDLLIKIDNIYSGCKLVKNSSSLNAVFKLPGLNDPKIFRGQMNLNSIGLGLLIEAFEQTKDHSYISNFEIVCATGIIEKYPTDKQISEGRFLDNRTGDIGKKFDCFIEFIKNEDLVNAKSAFIYSGKSENIKLNEKLDNSKLKNIEIIHINNFNELPGKLYEKKLKKVVLLVPVFSLFLFIISFLSQNPDIDPCMELLEAVNIKNNEELPFVVDACDDLEVEDSESRTALDIAVQNRDSQAAELLIRSGAQVNLAEYSENSLLFAKSVCEKPIYPVNSYNNLEKNSGMWGIFWEGQLPVFSIKYSMFDKNNGALECSIYKGEPYSGAHFYINMLSEPDIRGLVFKTMFMYSPETTYNNENGESVIQAIEFSISMFSGGKRYELALQWMNVGENAPQWRYWEPESQWIGLGIENRLPPDTWNELMIEGNFESGRTEYVKFIINGNEFNLNKKVLPVAFTVTQDYLAVACQLDSNFRSDPYKVFIKDIILEKKH